MEDSASSTRMNSCLGCLFPPDPQTADSAEVPQVSPTGHCNLHSACQHRAGQL